MIGPNIPNFAFIEIKLNLKQTMSKIENIVFFPLQIQMFL